MSDVVISYGGTFLKEKAPVTVPPSWRLCRADTCQQNFRAGSLTSRQRAAITARPPHPQAQLFPDVLPALETDVSSAQCFSFSEKDKKIEKINL